MRYQQLLLAIAVVGFAFSASAATINVGGACTLVNAITAANEDTATGGCPAGSGADVILLSPHSTHALTTEDNFTEGANGLPSVSTEITIQGNGSIIERSSTWFFRIFYVADTGDLTLDNVTVRNGLAAGRSVYDRDGSGLYNDGGTVTLNHSAFSDNHAITGSGGAISNRGGTVSVTESVLAGNSADMSGAALFNWRGTVTLTNTSVSGNSGSAGLRNFFGSITLINSTISAHNGRGGIYNSDGTMTLIDTTVSGNSAGLGGGISNSATITLIRSTVSGNSTTGFLPYGGGLYNSGTMTLINSTVSGNSAGSDGGGIYDSELGIIVLINSTIAHNSAAGTAGGLYHEMETWRETATLINTIVANNVGGDCGGPATIIDNGGNWFEDDTCNGIAQGDPVLGPLINNGGLTQTHALLETSGAIDWGENSLIPTDATTDQRGEGFPRIIGGFVDVGAFESAEIPPDTLVVNKTADTDDGVCDDDCSLREAIVAASRNGTIIVPTGIYTLTLGIGLSIDDSLTLLGAGAKATTIQAANTPRLANDRVFLITGGNVAISDVTIRHGNSHAGGGIFFSGRSLTLATCTVSNNDGSMGGGITVLDGTVTVVNSTIKDNRGGGVSVEESTAVLFLTNSTVSGNEAVFGSGIYNEAGTVSVTNSTVSRNLAVSAGIFAGSGGGIYNYDGTLTVTSSTVTENLAGSIGGVSNTLGTATLSNTIVAKNVGDDCSSPGWIWSAYVIDNGGNWFEDDTCNGVAQGDPGLGPLMSNGGPTQTHALLETSGAIDWGDNSLIPADVTTDQRGEGFPRIVGAVVDPGAIEFGACPMMYLYDHNITTAETEKDCQITAGPNLVVKPNGSLTLISKVRVMLGPEIWVEKGGRLRIQIAP